MPHNSNKVNVKVNVLCIMIGLDLIGDAYILSEPRSINLKRIKIAVEAKKTIPLSKLEPFQDELKTLPKEQYEKMRSNILKNGFSFAVHIWQHKGHNYIIDGHQRIFAVNQLVEVEGYQMPDVPVAIVQAKSFAEAKLKVLAGASLYGRVNELGLQKFLEANKLDIEQVVAQFDLPDIDLSSLVEGIFGKGENLLPSPEGSSTNLPSSSDGVRQVQLLFDAETHAEFLLFAEALCEKYGTENATDTVMGALRAEYKTLSKKSR